MSKLTRPTTNYPMYIQEGNVTIPDPLNPGTNLCTECIRTYVYPEEITSDVQISYVRKPKDVIWAYEIGSQGQYIWSGSPGATGPFLPYTEQSEVILKILAYAGVVIRDPSIIQAAAGQAATIDQNQKS